MKHPSVEQLRQMLVKHGLVDPCAVEDPEGFDNYRTLALIGDFWRELVEEVTGGGVVGHTCDTKQPGKKLRRLNESATAANTQRPSEPESGCESRTLDASHLTQR